MNAILVAALALVAATGSPAPPKAVPDRIFINGRVWTGDPVRPRATALALHGAPID